MPDCMHTTFGKPLLGDRSDAPHQADREIMEKLQLRGRIDHNYPVGFGNLRSDLGEVFGAGNPHRDRKPHLVLDPTPDLGTHVCGCSKQVNRPGHIGEGFIDRDAFDQWREVTHHFDRLIPVLLILLEVATNKLELGTEFSSLPTRHPPTNPERFCLVRSGQHYPAANCNRKTPQGGIQKLFDRGVEGIKVSVENGGGIIHSRHCIEHMFDVSTTASIRLLRPTATGLPTRPRYATEVGYGEPTGRRTRTMGQHEIVEASPLLDGRGHLIQVGWARQPLLDSNLEKARFYGYGRPLQRLRLKRWDYYGVTLPDRYFSATIADLGYAGQVFVYMVDFAKASYIEDTITIPFGKGVKLPRNSDSGVSSWANKNAALTFAVTGTERIVHVDWRDFGGSRLAADLTFEASHESTVVATPIGERRFYYNRKINCMPVEGIITLGDEKVAVDPATSSGTLDWGRGVWEYNSFWVWASGSGFLDDGRRVGLNLGYGFGDTSAATENTVLIDGRIHKLGEVRFDYDDANFMRPWTMKSDRIDVTFTPFLDRTARTNLLLIRSEVHQMFGHYSGTAIDDNGNDVSIDGVTGWAEEHQARW